MNPNIILAACRREHRTGTARIWHAEKCATFVSDAYIPSPCHRIDRVISGRGWDPHPPRVRDEKTGDVTTRPPDETIKIVRGEKGPRDIFHPLMEDK